jgi:hypothetical protein
VNREAIVGEWVHAHERDSAGAKVFVSAAEPLPPSRGRRRLTFRPDGTFVEGRPGADDRTVQASGTYEFDGKRLVLHPTDGGDEAYLCQAAGSGGQALRLKKDQAPGG